jgi:hypothetical protein
LLKKSDKSGNISIVHGGRFLTSFTKSYIFFYSWAILITPLYTFAYGSIKGELVIGAKYCLRTVLSTLTGKNHRYIGYNGTVWTPEYFHNITSKEGLYAPLVRSIAGYEKIPLKEAL